MNAVAEALRAQVERDIQPGKSLEAASLRNPIIGILGLIEELDKEISQLKSKK